MRQGVIVTGLPASGKTTVARDLAARLGFAFLDKDDFLEDLYDKRGVSSWDDRRALSRESDQAFIAEAKRMKKAVLVSHWRPSGQNGESGTPTEWLSHTYDVLVEVNCLCPAEEALARFRKRTRHPGHLDKQRAAADLADRFASWALFYPLGLGTLVHVATDRLIDMDAVAKGVRDALR